MLAIHISRDTLKYAQLVNFKGAPFVESLGKIDIQVGLRIQDTSSSEVIRYLAEQIANIRNSAEFPDNSVHVVIDSVWFPLLVHEVDEVLSDDDMEKYLAWRLQEMLDSSAPQYRLVHQHLDGSNDLSHQVLSLAIPQTFDSWLEKIVTPSELETKQVVLDIQVLGELLKTTGYLDPEGGIQVVLENRKNSISAHIYEHQEFKGLFIGELDSDRSVTPTLIRGDQKWVSEIIASVEKALQGRGDPDNVVTNIFYYTSSGELAKVNNLRGYKESCKPLNLHEHFNFRDPEFNNIDEYAVVLGALCSDLVEFSGED